MSAGTFRSMFLFPFPVSVFLKGGLRPDSRKQNTLPRHTMHGMYVALADAASGHADSGAILQKVHSSSFDVPHVPLAVARHFTTTTTTTLIQVLVALYANRCGPTRIYSFADLYSYDLFPYHPYHISHRVLHESTRYEYV